MLTIILTIGSFLLLALLTEVSLRIWRSTPASQFYQKKEMAVLLTLYLAACAAGTVFSLLVVLRLVRQIAGG